MPYTPHKNPDLIAHIEKSISTEYGENHRRQDEIARDMTGLSDVDKGPLKKEYIAKANDNEKLVQGADFTDMARTALIETEVLIKPKNFSGPIKHRSFALTKYK
jgi:hypothetical protein